MIRNRVNWGLGLMALLLALGTVACGSDEPAAVTPPAPPPAPPPFQPQPVEVALGASGSNVTLMTTESGGFTLNGEAFEGGDVTAENGNMYKLSLADGKWTAAFQAMEVSVMLGISGDTVTLTTAEDGSYWLGDMAVMSGSTTTAANGNTYALTMMDGQWMARFMPREISVALGEHGGTAMITKAEDGSYWLGDMAVMSGSTTMGMGNTYSLMMDADGNWTASYVPAMGSVAVGGTGLSLPATRDEAGNWSTTNPLDGTTVHLTEGGTYMVRQNTYLLSSDGMGMWTAAYQEAMVTVMLGMHGGPLVLTRAEDGSYWLGDVAVMSGHTVTAANGNMYTLSMDMEGMWSAAYVPTSTTVMLGISGDAAELVKAEDGSYWLGDMGVMSGSTTMSSNGNTYRLDMADGAWTATFVPDTMEIMGTGGLMAIAREGDDMWDVSNSGSTLSAAGAGNITTNDGAMYRVSMMDGMLSGVRFDGAPKGDTVHITVGLYDTDLGRDAQVSYIADDRGTAFNEANTKLTVAGESISLGDLLGDGMASKAANAADGMPGEYVEDVLETLMDLRTEAELYAKYQAEATDDAGRSAFDERLNSIAERAQEAIDMIFGTYTVADGDITAGTKKVDLVGEGTLTTEATASATNYVRAAHTVRGLNRLLDALSSADAFVAATKDGNDGVFEGALGETDAMNAFSANKSEYSVYLGTTENTRYGAIALKERVSAEYDDGGTAAVERAAVYGTRYQFDGSPTDNNDLEVGSVGAFSYANVNDTLRSRNLPQTGGAVYSGGTVAVTPGGTLYRGDMRIDVNFRSQSVDGRVSELKDKDNNLWQYLNSDVTTIYLPRKNYNNLTQFGGLSTGSEDAKRGGTGEFGTAHVVYAESGGFSTTPVEQPIDARFAGRFIGTDGGEIVGTWSLGQPEGPDTPTVPTDATTGKSDNRDVIFGSYGVTRQTAAGPAGPADGTAGGAAKTTVVLPGTDATASPATLAATFAGDTDVAGILRLGKRSTGGGKDVNNDFDLQKIFARPGADPKKTVNNSPKHVAVVVDHIKAQRAIYVIYAEQVGGDSAASDDLANVGRQNAWKSINDFVKDHIFDLDAVTLADDADAAALLTANLASPLGTYHYPKTRNDRPDDGAALERIDALLAAFDDVYAFEAALKDDGGGVFDNQPALDNGATDRPFPLDVPLSSAANYTAEPVADVFGRTTSQTQLFTLSTDYTRFGVWFRRETASAVADWMNHESPTDGAATPADTGSTSPGSYGYSWLAQSSYRVDRPVATYPSSGLATYEGRMLATLSNTHVYLGDTLIRVNWMPLAEDGATTSTIVPIFSNIRKWQDGSMDRLMNDSKIVDRIVLRASATAPLLLTADGEKLGITSDSAIATISYTDGSAAVAQTETSNFMAKFVGSSGDGPLGVVGTFRVPVIGSPTNNVASALNGSFGADLTSFETLLVAP